VDAPLVGATKTDHLVDAAAALDLSLTIDEIKALDLKLTEVVDSLGS
jgi:1-deoxyxylulose-5-phosphate synthase